MGVRGAGGENALLLEMRGFLSGTSVTPDDASADRPKVALHAQHFSQMIWCSGEFGFRHRLNVQIRGMALFVVGLMFHRD